MAFIVASAPFAVRAENIITFVSGECSKIFGKAVKPHDYLMREGDRVEIYRPLLADPKAVRKARAAKAKQA